MTGLQLLEHDGGTLLVGVEDRTGAVVGLGPDIKLFADLDGLIGHISLRLHREVPAAAPFIEVGIEKWTGPPCFASTSRRAARPCLGGMSSFRENNTTQKLKGDSLVAYLRRRQPADRGGL